MYKVIAGIIVMIFGAIAVYLLIIPAPIGPSPSEDLTPTDVSTEATELSLVLGEEYSILIQEEIDKLAIEQTDFNNQAEDQIATDISQFYYD